MVVRDRDPVVSRLGGFQDDVRSFELCIRAWLQPCRRIGRKCGLQPLGTQETPEAKASDHGCVAARLKPCPDTRRRVPLVCRTPITETAPGSARVKTKRGRSGLTTRCWSLYILEARRAKDSSPRREPCGTARENASPGTGRKAVLSPRGRAYRMRCHASSGMTGIPLGTTLGDGALVAPRCSRPHPPLGRRSR